MPQTSAKHAVHLLQVGEAAQLRSTSLLVHLTNVKLSRRNSCSFPMQPHAKRHDLTIALKVMTFARRQPELRCAMHSCSREHDLPTMPHSIEPEFELACLRGGVENAPSDHKPANEIASKGKTGCPSNAQHGPSSASHALMAAPKVMGLASSNMS